MSAAEISTRKKIYLATGTESVRLKFPCSAQQRRIWMQEQISPLDASLNLTARWRLQGNLKHAQLKAAFELLIARHPSLRTSFSAVDGEPLQIVAQTAPLDIGLIDLSRYAGDVADLEIERLAKLEKGTSFELDTAPLLRVAQLRLSSSLSIVLLTVHAIVCDESSLVVLARELCQCCIALQAGRKPHFACLPFNYGDYAQSQVAKWNDAATSRKLAHWQRSLANANPCVMPTDRARVAVRTADNKFLSRPLGARMIEQLRVVARNHDSTLFGVGMASLLTLLHRYTGETDIVVTSQHDEREIPELKNLLGPFTHTLAVRSNLSGDPTFAELLRHVHSSIEEAMSHERMPLGSFMQAANAAQDSNAQAFHANDGQSEFGRIAPNTCAVTFVFHESFIENEVHEAFCFANLSARSAATATDLIFCWRDSSAGWQLICEYNPDLFDARTIEKFLDHLQTLLRSIGDDPQQSLSQLPILGREERQTLIAGCNRTAADFPLHLTLPELFAAQVRLTPHADAIVCREQSLTYRELSDAVEKLQVRLLAGGHAPHTRIAVMMDRSPELVVALLAVLQAGSTYIPLDPNYPHERLLHVLENAKPSAIISRTAVRQRLGKIDTPIVLVDERDGAVPQDTMHRGESGALTQEIAYLIYTSGSTGVPKGVQISHRSLVNFLCAMRLQPGMEGNDVLLAVTTVSFDIAVLELFLPLIVGAKIVIAREDETLDGHALLDLLARYAVTVMQATPVTWQLLVDAGWNAPTQPGPPSKLKMLCGGETMPRQLADVLLARGAELWNLYGPTETTVWSSVLRVTPGEGPVPIGPPIANTQFYILDRHLQLVPPGIAGELFIGGEGVALGYVDLPIVTHERFLPDPFSEGLQGPHGKWMYRTGDIVRMHNDGASYRLEYLGRMDHQVKLRGHRIELGEIESILLRHPDIVHAVATVGTDSAGERCLQAYVVAKPLVATDNGYLPDALLGELRGAFEKLLPRYMHPSAIIPLAALPRMPNGKIDRSALQQQVAHARMDRDGASIGEPVAPCGDFEIRLARIWSSVLNIREIAPTADFFALGGHSILAARLLNAIEQEFSRRLTLAMLFAAPSIRAQALLLGKDDSRQYDFRRLVRLHASGSRPPLIAIHNTGVYYYNLSKLLGADQPLTVLQLFDPLMTSAALPARLEDVAAEYVRLLRQVQPCGPYQLLGWCIGGVLAFEVARQLNEQAQAVAFLGLIDAWAPNHLRRVSKLRAALADESYRLQLIFADWQRVLTGKQRVGEFIARRTVVKQIMKLFGGKAPNEWQRVQFEQRCISREHYDRWLQGYLEEAATRYEPKPYRGAVTLFCSAQEPRGLFLDPYMGWSPFAASASVEILAGDHFTLFQGKGLEQMARTIRNALFVS